MLAFFASVGRGQTLRTIGPVVSGWGTLKNPPTYSWSGTAILSWSSREITVDAPPITPTTFAQGRFIANLVLDGNNGTVTGACLNASGTRIFYGTTKGLIYDYNISNQTQTLLAVNEGPNNGPTLLTPSKDGTKLAYEVTDLNTAGEQICIYNLTSNTFTCRFDFVNSSIASVTSTIGFVNGDQDVVLSGPTLYNLSGHLVASVSTNHVYPVAISPDETKVFSAAAGDNYKAFTASNLAQIWDAPAPVLLGVTCWGSGPVNTNNYYGMAVSSDSEAVLFAGFSGSNWYEAAVSASTGKALSGESMISYGSGGSPWLVTSPTRNELLIGWSANDSFAWLSEFNSATGSFTTILDAIFGSVQDASWGSPMMEGTTTPSSNAPNAPLLQEFQIPLSISGTPLIYPIFPNANEGVSTLGVATSAAFSPNSTMYALINGSEVDIYTAPANELEATYTAPQGLVGTPIWGGNGRLWVSDGTHVYVLSESGTSLTLLQIFTPHNAKFVRMSPDGDYLATCDSNDHDISVYSAASGTRLYGITAETNTATGIDDVSFSTTGRIAVQECTLSSGIYVNQCRVYHVVSNNPSLVSIMSYAIPSSGNYKLADAVMSPDGTKVIMGNPQASSSTNPLVTGTMRLYNTNNGAQLGDWDNQMVADYSNTFSDGYNSTFCFTLDSSVVGWSSDGCFVMASTSPATTLVMTFDQTSVIGGNSFAGVVRVDPPSSTATTVTFASSSSSLVAPASFSIPANSVSGISFNVSTKGVATPTNCSLTASAGSLSSVQSIQILPASAMTMTLSPSTIVGGHSSVGTVTLNGQAGSAGLTLPITVSNSATSAIIPSLVKVNPFSSTGTFNITSNAEASTSSTVITASNGTLSASATLTVERSEPIVATFSPSSVTGGQAATLTITLQNPAGSGGAVLTLSSNNSALMPRGSVTIPAGGTTVSLGVATGPVSTSTLCTLTVSDSSGQTSPAQITVIPPIVLSASAVSSPIVSGQTAYALVNLTGAAPAGFKVACSSGTPSAASIPASFTFPTGQPTALIPITTTAVTTQTQVTISVGGQSFLLTLLP
jgi:hypothetical protein